MEEEEDVGRSMGCVLLCCGYAGWMDERRELRKGVEERAVVWSRSSLEVEVVEQEGGIC